MLASSRVKLKTLGNKVNTTNIVTVGVVLDGDHSRVQLLIGHGHLLDAVPSSALLDLDDLSVSGELVGDLPHARHTHVGELDGVVAVPVRHDVLGRSWSKTMVLKIKLFNIKTIIYLDVYL